MALCDSLKIWGKAILYGVIALFSLLIGIFTKGPHKLFYWKRWDRPRYLDDPTLGQHGFLSLKDVRIHYVASGPENRPLMLFVHGFPEFWYSWRYQLREFQKDYRVVAIDQRGYSESGKPAGVQNYSLDKLMGDLEQVIPALGYKSCILVAHDWGGLVAWEFARLYPQLVDKLIIMNAPPFSIFNRVLNTNKEQAKKSWYIYFFQLPWLPELNIKLGNYSIFDRLLPVYSPSKDSDSLSQARDECISPYKYTFSQPGAITPPLNYYRCLLSHEYTKFTNQELKYTMPILVIWGCADSAIDIAVADAMEKEIPNVQMKRIKDGNHFVQIDKPDEVNRFMREWLA